MSGFLTEEQIGELLLQAFETQATTDTYATGAEVDSDGTSTEVHLRGYFDLDDIAEQLRSHLVMVEPPPASGKPSHGTNCTDFPTLPGGTVTAWHLCGEVTVETRDGTVAQILSKAEALDQAARLITAVAALNHPALANRSQP